MFPADWPGLCNTGHLQSPINIQTDEVSPSEFPPFFFENYEHSYHMTLSNNGHSGTSIYVYQRHQN